jgi:hypothetical protein
VAVVKEDAGWLLFEDAPADEILVLGLRKFTAEETDSTTETQRHGGKL